MLDNAKEDPELNVRLRCLELLLKEPDGSPQAQAARAFAAVQTDHALALLAACEDVVDSPERVAALQCLAQDESSELNPRFRWIAVEALVRGGHHDAVQAHLAAFLQRGRPELARRAVQLVGELRLAWALPALGDLVVDRRVPAARVLEALARFGEMELFDATRKAAQNRRIQGASALLQALSRLGGAKVRQRLAAWLPAIEAAELRKAGLNALALLDHRLGLKQSGELALVDATERGRLSVTTEAGGLSL